MSPPSLLTSTAPVHNIKDGSYLLLSAKRSLRSHNGASLICPGTPPGSPVPKLPSLGGQSARQDLQPLDSRTSGLAHEPLLTPHRAEDGPPLTAHNARKHWCLRRPTTHKILTNQQDDIDATRKPHKERPAFGRDRHDRSIRHIPGHPSHVR